MEAILASQSVDTDILPPNLKYAPDPTGSFVTAKAERTVFALGSSYSPGGVRMITIPIGSTTEWLVPESLVFSALISNEHATRALWPASPDANVLFERVDIRLGGNLIESVTESARVNQLFTNLTMSPTKKLNAHQMGFGTQISATPPEWDAAQQHDAAVVPFAAAGVSNTKRIHWRCNLSGLLSQHRAIPLFALSGQGLTISWFLAPAADSTILSHASVTYSQDYKLTDVKAHCTLITLADELQESFNGQLLQGNPIRIPIKKLESMWSYIPTGIPSKFTVPMTRNYTRLASIYASFAQEQTDAGKLKLCNNFYVHTASAETLSHSFQIGARRIPDNDVVGFSESWYRLLNCIGIGGSLSHSTGVTHADYATHSFALACDLEKIPQLSSSGENVSNVGQIQLNIAGFGTTAADLPSRAHLVCQIDALVECRDTTVELFE